MSCVIIIHGWANGRRSAVEGQYVKSVDVQKAPETIEWLITTRNIEEAKKFRDSAHALRTYYEILDSDPVRPDGKPNRPFTALTISVEPVPLPDGSIAPKGTR